MLFLFLVTHMCTIMKYSKVFIICCQLLRLTRTRRDNATLEARAQNIVCVIFDFGNNVAKFQTKLNYGYPY